MFVLNRSTLFILFYFLQIHISVSSSHILSSTKKSNACSFCWPSTKLKYKELPFLLKCISFPVADLTQYPVLSQCELFSFECIMDVVKANATSTVLLLFDEFIFSQS